MSRPERWPLRLLGVPVDLGAGRRGVDMGPSAIRYACLAQQLEALGLSCRDGGDLAVPLPEATAEDDPRLRHLGPLVTVCGQVRDWVVGTLQRGEFPLLLGGDHSLSIGTLAAVGAAWERPGVIWVDAHGDFNTPQTTPSGNVHGMALAVGTGRGAPALLSLFQRDRFLDPRRVALVGARSLDPGEKAALKAAGVHVFTMTDIDRHGIQEVMQAVMERLARADALHLSFDLDGVDPDVAPGVGTPVAGGLSYREAHFVMEFLAESGRLRSLEVVELNPILDERNRTGRLAVELVTSALGKRIF